MNDTSAEIDQHLHELIMQRSPAERMRMAANSFEAARRLVMASLPKEMSEIDKKIEFFTRMYARDFSPAALSEIISAIRQRHEKKEA